MNIVKSDSLRECKVYVESKNQIKGKMYHY